jgi:hypothetical protein
MNHFNVCASNGVCVGTTHAAEWGALLAVVLFFVGFYLARRAF